jgi:large subunit ribosomal protein L3
MMLCGLVTKKLGMTSLYDENFKLFAVTVLSFLPCTIVEYKVEEKHGYNAIVLGYGIPKEKSLTKPQKCVFTAKNLEPTRHLKEFRVFSKQFNVGHRLSIEDYGLNANQMLDATSFSIGKGFAGVMKRHNFGGLEASHGVSVSHRSAGSTGGCQDPGKVFKNKKMAGQMGAKKVTVQNLKIFSCVKEKNILLIRGAIPGSKNSTVFLRDAVKQ